MKNDIENDDGFCIKVYSPGNFIAKDITITAPIYIGTGPEFMATGGFSDEQIKTALLAIVGKEKPIDLKWKWAGAYWYLSWACSYPVDVKKFCEKIDSLRLNIEEKYRCDYRNIREIATLSFMNQDARKMDKVQYSKNDEQVFAECREIALKLGEELGKAYLPKI